MLDFAKPSIRKTPASALIHNLEGVSILMIDDKFPDLQNRFQTDIAKVLNSSYTKIAEREQNGAKSHIYIDDLSGVHAVSASRLSLPLQCRSSKLPSPRAIYCGSE